MDSEEDEELSFEEEVGHRPGHHGAKLNEILTEVETKIPSLEFDDDDDEEDISVWSPPDNVPSFYKQFTSTCTQQPFVQSSGHQTPNIPIFTPVNTSVSSSIKSDQEIGEYNLLITASEPKHFPKSEIFSSKSSKITNYDLLVSEQKQPNNTRIETVVKSLTSCFSAQLDCNEKTNSNHNCLDHNLSDKNSFVSSESSASQTDEELFSHKQNISTTLDEKVLSSSSTVLCEMDDISCHKPIEKVVKHNVTSDKDTSSTFSLHSSMLCQIDQSMDDNRFTTKSTREVDDYNSLSGSLLSNSSCTDNNFVTNTNNTRMDRCTQTFDDMNRSIITENVIQESNHNKETQTTPCSGTKNDIEHKDQLDFDLLNEINFHLLHSVLETFPANHALSVSDLLPIGSQKDELPVHACDDELMLKLSDLSKTQLSACTSLRNDKKEIIAESLYQKKRVQGNRICTKTIHTWSQLSNDDTAAQDQPQTIFLDLRPDADLKNEQGEEQYSESIQRILGLNKKRSVSLSDDESDEELTEWHEMRTKLKEKAKQCPKTHKESTNMHASKPSSLRRAGKAPVAPVGTNKTVDVLSEEELIGGIPYDTLSIHENILVSDSTTNETTKNTTKADVVEKTTQSAKILETDLKIPYKNFRGEECRSEEKFGDKSISRKTDNSCIEMKLKYGEKTHGKTCDEHVVDIFEINQTFLERHTAATNTTNAYDPIDGRENTFSNENSREYTYPYDHLEQENHGEESMTVQCHKKEDSIGLKSDMEVVYAKKNALTVQEKMHDELDERTATCNDKNDEKKLSHNESFDCVAKTRPNNVATEDIHKQAGLVSMANIKISLRFCETEEHLRDKENGLRESKNTKESSSKMFPGPNSDPTTLNNEKREEKTGVSHRNVVSQKQELSNEVLNIDLSTVHQIINNMKEEEKTRQSTMSCSNKTAMPSSNESKHKIQTKMGTSDAPREQKRRSQKEVRKLKEKLRTNLENMKPSVTTNGKHPAAFNTPIIYDQDASFEEQQQGLLSTAKEDQLSLLLVVTLTGCGEINSHSSKGRNAGSGNEINHYYALVSWFLYLCGPNNSDDPVPFVVVAMHQACQNGLLQLFVAVQPNEKVFHVNTGKGNKKNKTRNFNKAISKYLSTHSLRSVYQNMENVYLNGSYLVDESCYSSKMLSTCITVGQDSNAARRVFNGKVGFYWETMELEGGNDNFQDNYSCDKNVENTVVFVRDPLYYHPSCVLDLLMRIETEGCDVAGLRLIEEHDFSGSVVCYNGGEHEYFQSKWKPTFVLAIRGPFAISKIKKIIGSKIPLLDGTQGIPSLRSLYCFTNTEDKLFYCPSYSSQAATQLTRMFGGRLTEEDMAAAEVPGSKAKPCSPDSVPAQKPSALLVSSSRVAVYLVVSPLVPPSFFGELFYICFLRGFVVHGIRRVQLSKRQGSCLGFSQLQFNIFCQSSGSSPVQSPSGSPPSSPARRKSSFSLEAALALAHTNKCHPTTILILQKENGLYHSASLVKHLFESLKDWMTTNPTNQPDIEETTPRMYMTITQLNEGNTRSLWGDVCFKPNISLIKHARNNRFLSSNEAEQICVLSSVDKEATQNVGLLLKKLTNSNFLAGDWELLGLKSFPSLSLAQAREVTPYEIGDSSWLSNIKLLMSATVFVVVMRGLNIIQRVRDFMISLAKVSTKEDSCLHQGWWLSQTIEVTYRQLTMLFEESELFSDETNRSHIKFLPPIRQKSMQGPTQKESKGAVQKFRRKLSDHKAYSTDDSSTSVETTQFHEVPIIQTLLIGLRPLPTIAVIKPSCVANTKKISKIFKSILQENFYMVALNMRVLTSSEAQVLIRNDEPNCDDHIQYLTSGASIVMCLQRENAVKKLLDILGPEDPVIARSLDPFLLRGCYGIDSIRNAVHGSESYSSAICELKMLFPCGVCCEETVDLEAEQIPCRAFDAIIGKTTERKLTKCFTQSFDTAPSFISSLVQINCVILTHHIVYGRNDRKRILLVDVLECLCSTNFALVGMKMATLTPEQVNELLTLIDSKSRSKHNLEKQLTEGPCIILALQRDNAITCFDSIIESAGERRSIVQYREHMIQAKSEEELSPYGNLELMDLHRNNAKRVFQR